jgi:hypothetical protein
MQHAKTKRRKGEEQPWLTWKTIQAGPPWTRSASFNARLSVAP